jgi:hypothetical protein
VPRALEEADGDHHAELARERAHAGEGRVPSTGRARRRSSVSLGAAEVRALEELGGEDDLRARAAASRTCPIDALDVLLARPAQRALDAATVMIAARSSRAAAG